MLMRFTSDSSLSLDGVKPGDIRAGQVVDLPENLAATAVALGHAEPYEPEPEPDDLDRLKERYKAATGRPAHYSWDAERLREKLAEVEAE